jgi:hypothetical protein
VLPGSEHHLARLNQVAQTVEHGHLAKRPDQDQTTGGTRLDAGDTTIALEPRKERQHGLRHHWAGLNVFVVLLSSFGGRWD